MKKIKLMSLVALSSVALVACTNQDVGTVSGAAIGGLVGSQFGGGSGKVLATGAGMLIGASIGNRIGRSMDIADQNRMALALENNRIGQPSEWTNPDTHVHYVTTPTKTYERRDRGGETQACREYTTTATIGGKTEEIYGTACRMNDGSWQTVK